jgi:hypothetical protein
MRAPSFGLSRSSAALASLIAVALLATAATAFAASAHFRKGHYAGTTSQGKSLSMRLSSPHRIRSLKIAYATTCDAGGSFGDNPTIHHATFSGRRFKGSTTYDNTNASGFVVHVTMHVSGKPTRRGAKGNFRVTAIVDRSDTGRQVDTCRSGTVTWKAKRKG